MAKESELRKLSEDRKATVLDWIDEGTSLREVIQRMDRPEPEGFGIRTNLGSLSRMVALWRSEQLLKARPEEAERARAILRSEEETITFQKATIAVLQQRLFESASSCRDGREQRETLRMYLEHEIKMRKLELAEKKLEESKRQFEFNAARLAMKYWHEFREIDAMEGPDDEGKIWLARDVMFVGPNGENPVKPRNSAANTSGNGRNDKGNPNDKKHLPLTPQESAKVPAPGASAAEPAESETTRGDLQTAKAPADSAAQSGKEVGAKVMHKSSPREAGTVSNVGVKTEEAGKSSGTTCDGKESGEPKVPENAGDATAIGERRPTIGPSPEDEIASGANRPKK